ncbi:MAG: SEC-C metal-binding domain-containing protein [Treponema sp.]|nr:SEC-C metal-binding domain-containing protein [Treponema sp.]
MTQKKAKQIFEKYNPQNAVTRCPNGRAPVRKTLDIYARAAVNLYGIIPIEELAGIFNSQNAEQTNEGEIFTLLLPGILKKNRPSKGGISNFDGYYCFYKDCLIHYWAADNFDFGDYWLREQGDKPRFIPNKNVFIKYETEFYEDEIQELHWDKFLYFLLEEWPKPDITKFYDELKDGSQLLGQLSINDLLSEYGLTFSTEKQIQTFLNLINNAHNNTRMWINKGHTPNELHKMEKKRHQKNGQDKVLFQERRKVGVNEPCPCGSGKKYKYCCRPVEEARTAQLHWSECTLFYETWYGLMGFVNEKKKILETQIKPIYPNPISDELIYKVREALWKSPELITDYLASVNLQREKAELLKSWRDRHLKGMFLLMEYKPEYAVVIGSGEKEEDRLYGITGISRPLSDVLQHEIPVQFETVLLPFKDKIIYDSYIGTMNISFGKNIRETFSEMYTKAMENGIITRL